MKPISESYEFIVVDQNREGTRRGVRRQLLDLLTEKEDAFPSRLEVNTTTDIRGPYAMRVYAIMENV